MRGIHYLSRDQLAAVSHPLRQRILDLLVERGQLSGREIVGLIPAAPSNPYYHLDVLRKAGLIEVVRTEPRRGAMETYYGSVARAFSLRPEELVGTAGPEGRSVREGILSVAHEGAESALQSLAQALETGVAGGAGEDPLINMCRLRLSPKRAAWLRARLSECLTEAMEESACADDGCEDYVFYELFFPEAGE